MNVSIICPIYNGESYIEKLFKKIREQIKIKNIEIIVPVSKSNDNSYEEAKKYGDIVYIVEKFNHGLTRHEAALKAKGDYLVFITQDIMPVDNLWLYNLLKNLDEKTVAAFSKQIAYREHGEVEKLIREFNYPDIRRVCNKENKIQNGRKNIFYSDSSSGILKNKFFELGGYNFNIPTNEDVILANNIVENNKSYIYEPISKVYHSHKLSLKETYRRYKSIGRFERMYAEKINFSNTNNEGKKMICFVINKLLKDGKITKIIFFSVNSIIKILSYREGKNE